MATKKTTTQTEAKPKKELTEAQKAALAKAREAREAKKAEEAAKKQAEEKTDNTSAEMESLKAQIAQLQEMLAQAQRPQVIQVSNDTERVHFLWQAPVADDNVQMFGENGMYGRIVGKTGNFFIPKSDLSRILDDRVRYMLDQRWLIVVSGLDAEEREALGCDYKEGEYLDKKAFSKMVELGDEMIDIYRNLCKGQREMVAQRYVEAYEEGSPYVTRDIVVKLNKISKELNNDKSFRGDFISIIESMNEADVN